MTHLRMVEVTPLLAAEWLARSNKNNRRLRAARVTYYARMMRSGEWLLAQPLIFGSDGSLLDGQHRLAAVVEANCPWPLQFYVMEGVTPESYVVMDDGTPRRVGDVADDWAKDNNRAAADARTLLTPLERINTVQTSAIATRAQVLRSIETHAEAIQWVLRQWGQRYGGGGKASVGNNTYIRTPCVRAYYHMNEDLLSAFIHAYRTGTPPAEMYERLSPAILLRNFVLTKKTPGAAKAELYAKTERAVWSVWCGQPVKKLYPATEELFPLPEEL